MVQQGVTNGGHPMQTQQPRPTRRQGEIHEEYHDCGALWHCCVCFPSYCRVAPSRVTAGSVTPTIRPICISVAAACCQYRHLYNLDEHDIAHYQTLLPRTRQPNIAFYNSRCFTYPSKRTRDIRLSAVRVTRMLQKWPMAYNSRYLAPTTATRCRKSENPPSFSFIKSSCSLKPSYIRAYTDTVIPYFLK
jgi:hypothetical protein